MEEIEIKHISALNILQLQEICIKTFYETFAKDNSEDNMKNYIDERFSLEKLNNELNNNNSEFYFAILNNNIIGYLKINYADAQTEIKKSTTLEIERIYVLSEYQGRKVGQLLFDKAVQIANIKKMEYIWLGVWERNLRAINFYKKNGFIEFGEHIFKLGDEEQKDIMMKMNV
ncbi:MAG: GNAT family N-acetyltransferase [Ignavibacteriae bacterium]|nr:GNAT family N-acetyltransferase [Ignavibacteriota bacterium]